MQGLVAVTGANGFVGRQVTEAMRLSGRTVRCLVRRKANNWPEAGQNGVHFSEVGDLFGVGNPKIADALSSTDILVHCAWYSEPGMYLHSEENIRCLTGTIQLAKQFAQSGGKRFIGIGSCSEYDLSSDILTAQNPLAPKSIYSACKVACFNILSNLLPSLGVEFVWCRLFYLYGDGEDERRLVAYLRKQLAAGQRASLSHGNQIRDYMDVKDASKKIVEIALGTICGPVNVCSGIPVSIKELAERIADEYGRRDLLEFGARMDNVFDPPRIVGVPG